MIEREEDRKKGRKESVLEEENVMRNEGSDNNIRHKNNIYNM